jgi:hypothetical protein
MPSNQTKDGRKLQKDEVKEEYGGYTIFFVLMVIIDCVWMLHRMLKAVGVCSLLLYGYPIYVDIRDKTGMYYSYIMVVSFIDGGSQSTYNEKHRPAKSH